MVVEVTSSELEVVEYLAEYIEYWYATRRKQETIQAGELVAVNVLREQWVESHPPGL